MFNGQIDYNEKIRRVPPISDTTRILQDPFMIVYDDNGKLEGVKIPESESEWSRNLKHARAASLQLDFFMINFGPYMKTHQYISEERTIHGMCQMDLFIVPMPEDKNNFRILKTYMNPENAQNLFKMNTT